MKIFSLLLILFFSGSLRAQLLHFSLEVEEESQNEKVYNFITDDLEDIVAWIFSMQFDGSKMKYKTVRNSLVGSIGEGSFYEDVPGNLKAVWFEPSLEPVQFPDSIVLFQIVFEVLQPEASTLCFSTDVSEFEIIQYINEQETEVENVLLDDECNGTVLVDLNPTSIPNDKNNVAPFVNRVNLSKNGLLSFSLSEAQRLNFALYDVQGRLVEADRVDAISGRNSIHLNHEFPGQVLYILIRNAEGRTTVVSILPD